MAYSPRYRVQVYDFLDTTTYGIGNLVFELENAKNLGYSEYANDVGESFFTVNQDDPKVGSTLADLLRKGGHVKIWRDTDLMFGGWLGESDESEQDVVLYAYGYASGFYQLHTGWDTTWTGQTVLTIVTDGWNQAHTGLTDSKMGWMTTGTLENPVTTSGGGTGIVLPFYRADYKRLLFLFQEMAAFSISDTTNTVLFEVTPSGTFNFWKNRGSATTLARWAWGNGDLIGYHRSRVPVDRRNTLYVVGSSPKDAVLRQTIENTTDRDTMGRSEEALYLSWVRDSTELTRVGNLRLARAMREDSDLTLTFGANRLIPARATGTGYRITDTVPVYIKIGRAHV